MEVTTGSCEWEKGETGGDAVGMKRTSFSLENRTLFDSDDGPACMWTAVGESASLLVVAVDAGLCDLLTTRVDDASFLTLRALTRGWSFDGLSGTTSITVRLARVGVAEGGGILVD